MSDKGVQIRNKVLLDSGCTPFRVPQSPEEVHDFEIFASLGRELRKGPGESKSLSQATGFRKFLHDDESKKSILGSGPIVLETIERIAPLPTSSGQNKSRLTYPITPVVPSINELGCYTRQKGNPWNPGSYMREMIIRGSGYEQNATRIFKNLFDSYFAPSLNIQESDCWAAYAEANVASTLNQVDGLLQDLDLKHTQSFELDDKKFSWRDSGDVEQKCEVFPARSFVHDLDAVLSLQSKLTRRQWVSIMDCFLRLALSSDILWVCRMGFGLANFIYDIEKGTPMPSQEKLLSYIIKKDEFRPMMIGNELVKHLKLEVRQYGRSILFLDRLIDEFKTSDNSKSVIADIEKKGLSDLNSLFQFVQLAKDLDAGTISRIKVETAESIDRDPQFSKLTKSKYFTCQHYYALRHALGQRSTQENEKTHFDQGYWAKRIGNPYRFSPGPLGLFLMAHLTNTENNGIATTSSLQKKLGEYGYYAPLSQLSGGEVGKDLRNLGLVVDCPDAQGGLIVRSPFS
jgi:hypothetical protein